MSSKVKCQYDFHTKIFPFVIYDFVNVCQLFQTVKILSDSLAFKTFKTTLQMKREVLLVSMHMEVLFFVELLKHLQTSFF
jgi:hypothetical protein